MSSTKHFLNHDEIIPLQFQLSQNYPNPFKDKTTIKYCIPYKTKVKITIYNSDGEMIEKLVDEEKEAGTYKIDFSAKGRSDSGGKLAECNLLEKNSKMKLKDEEFLYRLEAGNFTSNKQMILEK